MWQARVRGMLHLLIRQNFEVVINKVMCHAAHRVKHAY